MNVTKMVAELRQERELVEGHLKNIRDYSLDEVPSGDVC